MTTLPDITQSLCMAIARGEWSRLHGLALVAASKMGGQRGEAIQKAFLPISDVSGPPLKHWELVPASRSPWTPDHVRRALATWLQEVSFADQLIAEGERVRPLLLVGPTRCGKTSSIASLAAQLELPTYRLDLSAAVSSFMGETASKMRSALGEMQRPGIWLVDELDAVTFTRSAEGSAAQERAHAIGFLLTALDKLPPSVKLVATSNMTDNIDPAVRARFTEVAWPDWATLTYSERTEFTSSHGAADEYVATYADSYADAVKRCRETRVARIIANAKQTEAAAE